MSSGAKDADETSTVYGIDDLFDSPASGGGRGGSVRSAGTGSSGSGSGIRESDIERLAAALRQPMSHATSGADASATTSGSGHKVVAFDDDGEDDYEDDDATSVATTKRKFEPADEWDVLGRDDAEMAADFLSTWPEDRVSALAQHMRAAPWHEVRYRLRTYPQGLTGKEINAWIIANNFAKNDQEAHLVGSAMLQRRMFFQLNRKSKFRGFATTEKQQYTLNDDEDSQSLASRISRAVKGENVVKVVPFRVVKSHDDAALVQVIIVERQRRPDPSLPYNAEFLRPSDGPHFSTEPDAVPLPPVEDATPDQCEWVLDWEVVVGPDTDEHGWKYSIDFKTDPSRFVKSDESNKNFLTRAREWIRPARKRIERRQVGGGDDRNGLTGQASLSCVADDTEILKNEAEIEEEKKRELLAKAAHGVARVPRSGIFSICVHRGEDLMRRCDSFVTVESAVAGVKERSATFPRSEGHRWEFRCEFSITSDLEPIRISAIQAAALGRSKPLGTAELYIGPNEFSKEEDRLLLKSVDEGDDDGGSPSSPNAQQGEDDDFGLVVVSWKFVPVETASGATKQGASAIKRCVLHIHFEKANDILRERRVMGPCGVPVPGRSSEKASIFFRVHYLGDYCDMEAESPKWPYGPEVTLGWHFRALLLPSKPVQIELWMSDRPFPVGVLLLRHDASISDVEVPMFLEFVPPSFGVLHRGNESTSPAAALSPVTATSSAPFPAQSIEPRSPPTEAAAAADTEAEPSEAVAEGTPSSPAGTTDAAEPKKKKKSLLSRVKAKIASPKEKTSDVRATGADATSSGVSTVRRIAGRVQVKLQWIPELDAVEELVALGMDTSWSRAQKNMLSTW